MKIKVSELSGPALDWAVAKCIGHLDAGRVVVDLRYMSGEDPVRWEPQLDTYYSSAYNPSTNWAQGGPIIEREGICLHLWSSDTWIGDMGDWEAKGATPLVAAMRCFVASKLGDEVETPEELL